MHIRTIKEKYNYQKCFTSIQCVFRIILSQVDNQSNKNHKFNFSNSWLQKSWQLRNHFKLKLDGNYRRMDQDSMAAGNKETIMEVFYFSRNRKHLSYLIVKQFLKWNINCRLFIIYYFSKLFYFSEKIFKLLVNFEITYFFFKIIF